MNKGFELTKSQVSAFENGAKMFLVPILGLEKTSLNQNSFPFVLNINNKYEMMTEFEVIRKLLPIQKDDENIFIKEDFWLEERGTHCPIEIIKYNIDEYYESPYTRKLLASEMTEKQSRFLIKKCVDIKIIKPNMIAKTGYFDGAYLNEDILKGLGLEWIGYVSKECYENIGFKLFVNFYNSLLKEKNINRTYEDNDYMFLIEIQ